VRCWNLNAVALHEHSAYYQLLTQIDYWLSLVVLTLGLFFATSTADVVFAHLFSEQFGIRPQVPIGQLVKFESGR
jgi:hypothetical protein